MDFPRGSQTDRLLVGRELKYRSIWLIKLRYLAVATIVVGILGLHAVLGTPLATPILELAAFILFYNVLLHLTVNRVRFRNWYQAGYRLALFQVFIDILMLTLVIHGTGGVLTPLVFFYVFHAVIAAILLSRRAALLHSTYAFLLVAGLAFLEQAGILPPGPVPWDVGQRLGAPGGSLPHGDVHYTLAIVGVVGMTLYLSTYMTQSLSRELRAREEKFRLANEKLQEQDRLKSDYVRLIAHDLRDPLAAIRSSLRVVLDGYVGEIPQEQRSFIEKAEARAVHLSQLIRAMLDLARIRAHADLEKSDWCFVEMVKSVVDQLRPLVEDKGHELHLALPERAVPVHANRDVIEQVFQNLVGNAIKYTPAGGQVHVTLRASASHLEAEVGDTGIGIPGEALPRVFDEFFRASNAKRVTRDGTGLGLALVKQIVEAYGGEVSVESPWQGIPSPPPRGSVFRVRFSRGALGGERSTPRPGGKDLP